MCCGNCQNQSFRRLLTRSLTLARSFTPCALIVRGKAEHSDVVFGFAPHWRRRAVAAPRAWQICASAALSPWSRCNYSTHTPTTTPVGDSVPRVPSPYIGRSKWQTAPNAVRISQLPSAFMAPTSLLRLRGVGKSAPRRLH